MSLSADMAAPTPRLAASDDPRLEIRMGAGIAAVFFAGFLGWAAMTPLDAANVAPGSIMVAGHRQTVQSREGGVISKIAVAEGEHVSAGQLLVQFASADALAAEKSLAARVIDHQLQIARMQAEQSGRASFTTPAALIQAPPEYQPEIARMRAIEQCELNSQLSANHARRAVLQQRVQEASEQIDGYRKELVSNVRQQQLNDQELVGMRGLQAQGYAPATRVRALERSAASLVGDAGSQTAEIARLESTQGESHLQIVQGDSERAQEVSAELDKAQSELQELLPQWTAARQALARTDVRAPVAGAVVGLTVNTVGGVVGQGQKLMEIVPSRTGMVVEAQISPRDVEGMATGQRVKVRLSGLHGRNVPVLEGALSRLSADAFTDEKLGRAFYTATVSISDRELARLGGDHDAALKPGMPAEMIVILRKRTALQYMVEPLLQTFGGALHER